MKNLFRTIVIGLAVLSLSSSGVGAIERIVLERGCPQANVFLEDETVRIRVPANSPDTATKWRMVNDWAKEIAGGDLAGERSRIVVENPGIGWYRIEILDSEGKCLSRTTAAVLARLSAPTPEDSPVCVDSATAWFASGDAPGQERFAHLAALAGVNWVRDRMKWREIQPEPGRFEQSTTYDMSARIQSEYGLKVLQVFHDTPPWAVEQGQSTGRFVTDLRILYRFCKAMAIRYKGRVQAWEPWNEANVSDFGGHTTDEMCSYQKAAYLGFKTGDPDVTVCWNVSTAVPTALQTQIVLENETWPYFDTYNSHTYDWPDSYADLWGPVREAACGRPIWVTESDRGIKYSGPEPWCELTREGEIQKAEFMAQSYASSLWAGSSRHFHFILGNYYEDRNHVQFGLLRLDQTPRPAYVALAAVGRFLAGAKCLGKWDLSGRPEAHIYAFRARPDGLERDVLVAWAERGGEWDRRGKTLVDWKLPDGMEVEGCYDYLGRSLGMGPPAELRSAPVFVLLESGDASKLPLEPRSESQSRKGSVSPVVMQLNMPRSTTIKLNQIQWSSEYGHKVPTEKIVDLPVSVYNFADKRVEGSIVLEHIPAGWKLTPNEWRLRLEPMERRQLTINLKRPEQSRQEPADTWLKLRGDFGTGGRPVLAFRLISHPGEGYPE